MNVRCVLIAALMPIVVNGSISAHHSFASEFDPKPLTLTGIVTDIQWTNPHVKFHIDTKAEDGTVINWSFEARSPNVLIRTGWTRNSVQVGDTITVEGFRARDGRPRGNALAVVLTRTGERLSAIDHQEPPAR